MSGNLVKKGQVGALQTLENFIFQTGLENVKTSINTKTGTASITGSKDGYQYTTTVKREKHGVVQTQASFETNLGKEALISQVKQLLKEGYRQREVADMLVYLNHWFQNIRDISQMIATSGQLAPRLQFML